ncbi:MAG: hypothetical protein ACTSQI_14955 [Candidatus Helarchaeota archaeon]
MLYDPKIILKKIDISQEEKDNLVQEIRKEFPNDDLLFELHLFRAVEYLLEQKVEK